MKNIVIAIIVSIGLMSCNSSDDNNQNQNPYLVVPPVSLNLNLNLPEYNELKFPGGSVIVTNQGIKGIIVYCVSDTQYYAAELSDPNHTPNSCSKMQVEGIIASCPCDDDNKYDIITGQFTPTNSEKYPMIQYRAERNGDVVNVYN